MPDFPDYYVPTVNVAVTGLVDLAELANRLANIGSFPQVGNLYWYDDFERGIGGVEAYGSALTDPVVHDATISFSPSKSLKLSQLDAEGATSGFTKYFPLVVVSRLSFAYKFSVDSGSYSLRSEVRYYTLNWRYVSQIVYNSSVGTLHYLDENNVLQLFANDVVTGTNRFMFNHVEQRVDLLTQKYISFRINERTFDLSAYNLRASYGSYYGRVDLNTVFTNLSASSQAIHIDDVALYTNLS